MNLLGSIFHNKASKIIWLGIIQKCKISLEYFYFLSSHLSMYILAEQCSN